MSVAYFVISFIQAEDVEFLLDNVGLMPYRRQIVAVSKCSLVNDFFFGGERVLTSLFTSSWQTDTRREMRKTNSRGSHAGTAEIH